MGQAGFWPSTVSLKFVRCKPQKPRFDNVFVFEEGRVVEQGRDLARRRHVRRVEQLLVVIIGA